jgi:hypothetical protein
MATVIDFIEGYLPKRWRRRRYRIKPATSVWNNVAPERNKDYYFLLTSYQKNEWIKRTCELGDEMNELSVYNENRRIV